MWHGLGMELIKNRRAHSARIMLPLQMRWSGASTRIISPLLFTRSYLFSRHGRTYNIGNGASRGLLLLRGVGVWCCFVDRWFLFSMFALLRTGIHTPTHGGGHLPPARRMLPCFHLPTRYIPPLPLPYVGEMVRAYFSGTRICDNDGK